MMPFVRGAPASDVLPGHMRPLQGGPPVPGEDVHRAAPPPAAPPGVQRARALVRVRCEVTWVSELRIPKAPGSNR
eukprot:1543466-Pyramimonas_sp.AAC.2